MFIEDNLTLEYIMEQSQKMRDKGAELELRCPYLYAYIEEDGDLVEYQLFRDHWGYNGLVEE